MPIPSHQNHFRAPNAKPEPSGSILSQLTSNTSLNPLTPLRLSNALLNTPTPLCLADTFPTRRSFNLSSSLHQVDSRHPHSFPTRRLSTFTLLCQVYSRHLIGLTTVVGRSPIAYLSRSMCHSLSFLTLYISVCSLLCLIIRYPPFVSLSHHPLPSFRFSVSSSVPRLHPPLLNLSLFYLSIDPL